MCLEVMRCLPGIAVHRRTTGHTVAMHPPRHPAPWPTDQLFLTGLPAVYAHQHALPDEVRDHSHDFAEMLLVLGGQGLQRSALGQSRLRRHDLVLLPQGTWHGFAIARRLEIIDCCLGLEIFRRELAWTRSEPTLARLMQALIPGPERSAQVQIIALGADKAEQVRLAFLALNSGSHPSQVSPAGLIARTLQVLDVLARALPASVLAPVAPPLPDLVARAVSRLSEDLAHRWTLIELEARLGIDRSHLVRTFSRALGTPPMAYLARRRAERAAELLATTTWTIQRIGTAVGWPHAHHCSRRFRAHFGITASAYRSRARS